MRVGCDGRHTLPCMSCEYATYRGQACECPVNQGGTTEMISVLILSDRGGFFMRGSLRMKDTARAACGPRGDWISPARL